MPVRHCSAYCSSPCCPYLSTELGRGWGRRLISPPQLPPRAPAAIPRPPSPRQPLHGRPGPVASGAAMPGHAVPGFLGLRPAGIHQPLPGCLHPHHPRPAALRTRREGARAAAVAEPATVPVRSFAGEVVGSEQLALRVADLNTATGLVHRYITLIQQNARRVCACMRLIFGICAPRALEPGSEYESRVSGSPAKSGLSP